MVSVDRLREIADAERAHFGVPGVSVTAVAAGDVVLADGIGRRDDSEPVTSKTLFMLASDTKCFAAATLCLLVEDGLLDLDRPVQEHLPWFAMHDARVSEWVTCRDLLAHRTGLPRHELVTVGDGDFTITNEEIAHAMRHLEASRPFRQRFGYSNVHYATAGHVAEVLAGQPWRQILADRVLGPLGMTGTSTYLPELTKGDFAAPHLDGRRLPFQTRTYDLPSGGVVTNAEDLARWLLARLGQGPMSPAVLRMLHTPSVVTGEDLPFAELRPMGYALGNLVFAYRGHTLHLHGGSQVGFAGQVMVVPEARVGVAVMTNTYGTRLPLALGLTLIDDLLGLDPLRWGDRLSSATPTPAAAPSVVVDPPRDLRRYEGAFHHPAYGDIGFRVDDGPLAPSFHGLDDELTLTHVGHDDWRMRFSSVPGFEVAVAFTYGPKGEVVDVRMGLDPELAPVVFLPR
jgi:CubicO group peptidase (beta-lactamase class C family)